MANKAAESLFRTCKYRPDYPERGFASIETARNWVHAFVQWYNNVHRHSALKFVTPALRHAGHDIEILAARRRRYSMESVSNWCFDRNGEIAIVRHLY
ncbi:MAG: integrase core domain-containing protein [Bacteroidetes bacterium]|nr:integrase core domain-containing protein [Bacteroidota bacterium]